MNYKMFYKLKTKLTKIITKTVSTKVIVSKSEVSVNLTTPSNTTISEKNKIPI